MVTNATKRFQILQVTADSCQRQQAYTAGNTTKDRCSQFLRLKSVSRGQTQKSTSAG